MTNLLDLDNDILQIIGDYVKMDNAYRIEKEKDFFFEINQFLVSISCSNVVSFLLLPLDY